MANYLAVDVGGSRIKCFDSQTQLLFEGPGVAHSQTLAKDIAKSIISALPEEFSSCESVFLCLAAIPEDPADREILAALLYQRISFQRLIITTDSYAAALSLGESAHLTIAVGTGITAQIKTDTSEFTMSGHGYLIGDEGSSYWIGRHGLNAALRAYEGRSPETSLTMFAKTKFGKELPDLADHIHQMPDALAQIAGFATQVSEAAENEDAVAKHIMQSAADEILALIRDVQARVSVSNISLVGGAVSKGSYLRKLITSQLASLKIELIESESTPLDGLRKLAESQVTGSNCHVIEVSKISPANWSALYLDRSRELIREISKSQASSIESAAELFTNTLLNGGLIHTFGTGHSHLLAEEIFYRAGGLAAIYPISDERLMLHKDVVTASQNERMPGFAHEILKNHTIKKEDLVIIISNSGGNQVTIDVAKECKKFGVRVIALTSLNHATSHHARSQSLEKIHTLADVVLDNGGIVGDALVLLPGAAARIGPTSTTVGSAILHAVVINTVARLLQQGITPEIFLSSNMTGGDDNNNLIFEKFRPLVKIYT